MLNSGNLGYARVFLDDESIAYFMEHIGKVDDQLDRTYLWMLLFDSLKRKKITPTEYIDFFLKNIQLETEQMTLVYIIGKVSYIQQYFLKEDSKKAYATQIFDVLF